MFLFRLSKENPTSYYHGGFYKKIGTIDPDFPAGREFADVIEFFDWLQPFNHVPSHPGYLRATHLFYLFLLENNLVPQLS
jgi:hypothetical protein